MLRTLTKANLDPLARKLREFTIRSSYELVTGKALRELPANYSTYGDFLGEETDMIVGGYIELIKHIANGLTIHLNQIAKEIRVEKDKVIVTTNKGEFTGSHVIVTLPLGVLKKENITFTPTLPTHKQKAIDTLTMGKLEKIIMRFPQAFWRENSSNQSFFHMAKDLQSGAFPLFADVSPTPSQPTLAALIAGDFSTKLIAEATAADSFAAMKNLLYQLFGKKYVAPIHQDRSEWQLDPFTGGCYAGPSLQSKPEDFDILAEPHAERMLFAGEHTSARYHSYVHGAMESGIREARRLTQKPVTLSIA